MDMHLQGFSSLVPELIIWEDISQCDSTWASESDIQLWLSDAADAHIEQVGFVIWEDDKNLIITDSFIESMGLYGNVHKIPKSVVRKRVKLQDPI